MGPLFLQMAHSLVLRYAHVMQMGCVLWGVRFATEYWLNRPVHSYFIMFEHYGVNLKYSGNVIKIFVLLYKLNIYYYIL